MHALRAMRAIVWREIYKFAGQYGRIAAALARPALWLIVAEGMQSGFGQLMFEPSTSFGSLAEYMVPGLVGIVLLFNGVQSSLSLVYDREMGTMRLFLTAPLPRWYLLFCKLLAGTILSVVQAYAFLGLASLIGVRVPWSGWLWMLPAMFAAGFSLGSIGLLMSVYIRQLENFAGTMNFVIFPMFFLSSALYPLWRFRENEAEVLYWVANANPFTHTVELIRYAAYGEVNLTSLAVVVGIGVFCFFLAVVGYDPQRGFIGRRPQQAV